MKKDLDFRPSLEDVFEFYGARILAGSGAWQKAECPLVEHDDKNPSASVNVDAGKWQCWSCDTRGDGLDIIQANEESCAGFADAIAFAAANFAGSSGVVRPGRASRSGLPVRSGNHGNRGSWKPPWSRA